MKYAAMIRGVGPGNPNMRSEKLKTAFESLGFTRVQPVITSGNVVFESDITDTAELETMIEKALPRLLDFSRDVLIRSQAQLQALVDADPFKGLEHQNAGKTYLTATFFKTPPEALPPLPRQQVIRAAYQRGRHPVLLRRPYYRQNARSHDLAGTPVRQAAHHPHLGDG